MTATPSKPLQNVAAPTRRKNISTQSGLVLQRKCACGSSAGLTGNCSDCQSKMLLGKLLQPKLRVNESGDAYEEEADRVANEIMGGSWQHVEPRPATRVESGPRSGADLETRHPAESDLANGGDRLAPDVARFYETRFGRDFSAVRIHTGETAARYNDAVNAYAFTYGNHIWLGPGLGQRPSHILAHELAHVVQQTQPRELEATSGRTDLSVSPVSVQRFSDSYWIPANFIAKSRIAKPRVGSPTHALVLPKIGKENGIYTEAPVPNADSEHDPGYGIYGIADFYKATTTVGAYFHSERVPRNLASNSELRRAGEKLDYGAHVKNSAPRADEKRQSVLRTGKAPAEILVGDLKPSHGTVEASKGPLQVRNYLAGFKFAQKEVNKLSVGTQGFGQTDEKWPTLTTGPIHIKIPDEYREETRGIGQDTENLVLVKNGKRVDERKPPQFKKGKVYVKESPDKGGVWNYVWQPDQDPTPAELPGSVKDMGAEVQSKLITPVLQSPIQQAKKARPARPFQSQTAAPRSLQRLARDAPPAEVKDPFDKAAFDTWKENHRLLSDKEKLLEKSPQFGDAEFKSAAIQDREAAIASGFNFAPISKGETAAVKTVNKIQLWTHAGSAIFGKLRYWFGGLFVKVAKVYHAVRARFQNLLKDKGNTSKKGGLLGTVIRIAFDVLKAAGRVMVERTAQHVVESLKTGVAKKLKALIPEDKIEAFDKKVEEVTKIADDLEKRAVDAVEAMVERAIGPYAKHIETVAEIADKLSTLSSVVNKVRWGARAIACLSPPGWGCLWILAESVIEKLASKLVDSCGFKKEIAPLLTKADFIKELPRKLAGFIVEGIRSFLPNKLHDVFDTISTDQVSTDVRPHEICDKNDFPPPNRDRAMAERLGLEELKREVGEEKWEAWLVLGHLYGASPGDFLSEEQISKLKREIKNASLASMEEAAGLLGAFTPSHKVTNLTEFLQEAKQKAEEMYRGGEQGGDEGGIRVSAAEKSATDANFKPTKLGFQVVGGVTTGQHAGDVIKIDRAASIRGTVVTLAGVEVVVRKRVVRPNTVVMSLEVTRNQYWDIEKQYGADVVKKIGWERFEYKKGVTFTYTLQLKPGKAE